MVFSLTTFSVTDFVHLHLHFSLASAHILFSTPILLSQCYFQNSTDSEKAIQHPTLVSPETALPATREKAAIGKCFGVTKAPLASFSGPAVSITYYAFITESA